MLRNAKNLETATAAVFAVGDRVRWGFDAAPGAQLGTIVAVRGLNAKGRRAVVVEWDSSKGCPQRESILAYQLAKVEVSNVSSR